MHARKLKGTNIDSICGHSPLITICRFTQSGPFTLDGELGDGKCVPEEARTCDIDRCIIFLQGSRIAYIWALRWVANLLDDVVD